MKRLFVVAGEVSGDDHAAALARELPGGIVLSGLGGPRLGELSGEMEDWLEEAAVLGLWEVLRKYGYFKAKMDETLARISRERPDGVLLVDYPGFNLRLARRLRAGGYRGKLIYYISPQVWAWKRRRVKLMAELLDLMICIFPFEQAFYEQSGLPAVFAGHPLAETLASEAAPEEARDPDLVALLPGSREREVEALFPAMARAALMLRQARPGLKFASAAVSPRLAARLREIAAEQGLPADCLEAGAGNVREVMRRAAAGVVASGTATLEAACLGLPYCLVYRVSWPTYVAGRLLVRVPHLGIVNVIAGREVVRELIQHQATGGKIAAELERLLGDGAARAALRAELAAVTATLGEGGASARAAAAVAGAIIPGGA